MADIRVQVTIPRDSLIPADSVVNVFHFQGSSLALDLVDLDTEIKTFYQAIDGIILSSKLSTPAVTRYYDLADAEPRVPKLLGSFAVTPAAGVGMPDEVAMCLSFRKQAASGEVAARRKGRVYLGPLTTGIIDDSTATIRPNTTAIDGVADAAEILAGNAATAGYLWCVRSTVDDVLYPITHVSVDNAFDTQRRRGGDPTSRDEREL